MLPPRSIIFLTADYIERIPSEIFGIEVKDGWLRWSSCKDEEHCYYRVYANGRQVASTVDEKIRVHSTDLKYEVLSVDKWGNVRK